MTDMDQNIRLDVRGFRKSFGANEVLKGIDFTLEKGEVAVIIGSSGSGKTTMLRCLNFLETPTGGKILLNGETLFDADSKEKLSDSEIRRRRLHFGLVFQSFNLFATHTALDNVAMPLMYKGVDKRTRTARARKMLTAVGLRTHMRHKPTQMSGGQQQRVGIARALVTQPKILFADEPTGNLDFNTSREILRLIRDICHEKNTTLIMVTHDPEMAQYADRVIRLLDGKVIENTVNEQPEEIPMIVREQTGEENSRDEDEEDITEDDE